MPSPKVIQLRQLLADKFPGLRLQLHENPAVAGNRSLPNNSIIDELFENRLANGTLNEIVADGKSAGTATLIRAVLNRAADRNEIVGLVDGSDCFDATQV